MKKRHRLKPIMIFLIISALIYYLPNRSVQIDGQVDTVFDITLLCPNTNPARIEWANRIKTELAHIGINAINETTSWGVIYPRTFNYPGPYPVPTYAEGGYDMFFISFSFGLDYDPESLFHSSAITPNGDNVYQYYNPDMDTAIENYLTTYDDIDRQFYAEEIQDILYDDNPSIPIINNGLIIPHKTTLVNWNPHLWVSNSQPMENWTIPSQTEFHYANPADFIDFHPYHCESNFDRNWLRQIYNGLIERRESLDYGPRITTSWTTSDFLNYTVELNPNAKWADGTTLTTADVEFSYKLLINPDFNSPDKSYWSQYLRENSVTIIDADTCNISFNQNFAFQENHLALDLVPKHVWDPIDEADMETQAISWATSDPDKIFGAGPYQLEEYNTINDFIHLTRNEYYDDWTGITPYFDDIYFEFYSNKELAVNALAAGDINMMDPYFNVQIDEVPISCSYSLTPGSSLQEMALNMEHPYFGTGELCPIPGEQSANYVRKAISHIIPREWIVDNILNGIGFPGITAWPQYSRYFKNLEPYEYNITKAQEYMLLAGFDLGIDSDGDGLTDYEEFYVYFTDRFDPDSDDDLMPDGYEIDNTLDPLIDDSALDPDMDELTNIEEYNNGTNPQNEDTDDDGLLDGEEIVEGTNPLDPDSDGDGFTDKEEIDAGTDPLDPLDFPTTETTGLNYLLITIFSVFSLLFIIVFKRKK